MEKKLHKVDYSAIWELVKSNPALKLALYAAGGLLALFLAGKSFRIVASAVSGYKEMMAAFKN